MKCAGKWQLIKYCWYERVKWGSVLILGKPCTACFRCFSALTHLIPMRGIRCVGAGTTSTPGRAGLGQLTVPCFKFTISKQRIKELEPTELPVEWNTCFTLSLRQSVVKTTFGAIVYATKACLIYLFFLQRLTGLSLLTSTVNRDDLGPTFFCLMQCCLLWSQRGS